jgi:hypothetical protein
MPTIRRFTRDKYYLVCGTDLSVFMAPTVRFPTLTVPNELTGETLPITMGHGLVLHCKYSVSVALIRRRVLQILWCNRRCGAWCRCDKMGHRRACDRVGAFLSSRVNSTLRHCQRADYLMHEEHLLCLCFRTQKHMSLRKLHREF